MSIYADERARATSQTTAIFGQVMLLVGVAIAFLAVGSLIGRDLQPGTATILAFVAIGMIFAQSFVRPLRAGPVGMLWLFAAALILGIGLGPVLNEYVQSDPEAITQAAAGTALAVLLMGAIGLATSKDLARWIQARDRGRHRVARHRHLRLDREHLPVAAEPVRRRPPLTSGRARDRGRPT